MIVAGLDIGNQTTEVAIALVEPGQAPCFLAHAITRTTGIKGTVSTIPGARVALIQAAERAGISISRIDLIRINEGAPVVAGVAMQAITQTTLTDSTLIGHNPESPGGAGLGVGRTAAVTELHGDESLIAIVDGSVPFESAAMFIRIARDAGVPVVGAIVQSNDGVLISNRIGEPAIPVVDEVTAIDRVPFGQLAAVEVAPVGTMIQTLCNPYGLATLFHLDAVQTSRIAPAARALTGLRSAVIIRTPEDQVEERTIEPGSLTLIGKRGRRAVDIRAGAAAIARELTRVAPLHNVLPEAGTAVGAMFGTLRADLSAATGLQGSEFHVADLFPSDLSVFQPVVGGLSNEVIAERAVALAAMVETESSLIDALANTISVELHIPVLAGGREADAGIRGALTTPGTGFPLCVLDLGSGSTNAARIDSHGEIARVHLAGGGSMVNLLLGEELGIDDPDWREHLKRLRVARVDSLFSIRHEDGFVAFLPDAVSLDLFGRTVLLHPEGMRAVPGNPAVDRIVETRRRAKKSVFGVNAERALHMLAPGGNPRFLSFVVLIGGSALDFELPAMLAEQLSEYGVVTGTANVRGEHGPRNAVATGLIFEPVML